MDLFQGQIQANGLNFTYRDTGGDGPLVLCLHGFPDTPHTWSDLMPRLHAAGYRAVAPFMRGYPPTEAPANGSYSAKDLAEDAVALLDAFGAATAIIIGHDWGALAAYAAVALAPERFERLITVAIPHPRALNLNNPRALWAARHFVTFQVRGATVAWMERDNYAALDTIYRRWSPTWDYPDTELAPAREALAQPGGVEGMLGYYWSFLAERRNPAVQTLLRRHTTIPTLTVLGEADGALALDTMKRPYNAFTGAYTQVIMPGAGHFLHREKPQAFADHVLSFLAG